MDEGHAIIVEIVLCAVFIVTHSISFLVQTTSATCVAKKKIWIRTILFLLCSLLALDIVLALAIRVTFLALANAPNTVLLYGFAPFQLVAYALTETIVLFISFMFISILKEIKQLGDRLFHVLAVCISVFTCGIWILTLLFIILIYIPAVPASVNLGISIFFYGYFSGTMVFVALLFAGAGCWIGCTSFKSVTTSSAAMRIFVLLFGTLVVMVVQIVGYFVTLFAPQPLVFVILSNVAPLTMNALIFGIFRLRKVAKNNKPAS